MTEAAASGTLLGAVLGAGRGRNAVRGLECHEMTKFKQQI